MANTTHYYIGFIFERNGTYEYENTILLELTEGKKLETALDDITINFYPDATDKEEVDNGVYFNCGEVYLQPGRFTEITEDVFKALSNTHLKSQLHKY